MHTACFKTLSAVLCTHCRALVQLRMSGELTAAAFASLLSCSQQPAAVAAPAAAEDDGWHEIGRGGVTAVVNRCV
jgi:hypothetical protein